MKKKNKILNESQIQTTNRYNEIAFKYAKDWRGQNDKNQLNTLNRFIQLLQPKSRMLDLGCGTGKDAIYFAENGFVVTGYDLSSGMLNEAKKMAQEKNVNVHFHIGNMCNLDIASNSIDAIWTTAALVHLNPEQKKLALKEFQRVLKPGGYLHIWVQNLMHIKHLYRITQFNFRQYKSDNEKNIINLLKNYSKGYAEIDKRHWHWPTKWEMNKKLKEYGFDVIDTNNLFSRRLSMFAKLSEKINE